MSTRKNVTSDRYLFTQEGHDDEPASPKVMSSSFGKLLRVLRANKQIEFKVLSDKPSEIRLYNLRKFFKKYANQAGSEYTEFWMGHRQPVIDNYRSNDPEHHRQLYANKAMPFLRIEQATPSETDKVIQRLESELADSRRNTQYLEGTVLQLSRMVKTLMNYASEGKKPNKQIGEELEQMLNRLEEQAKAHGAEEHISEAIERQAKKAGLSVQEYLERRDSQ